MAGVCTSCGKGKDKDADGKTVITVGGWPSKDGKEKDNIEERKARFEEANTDVKITPDNWNFDLKSFYAKAAGGQLPTVYNTNFTEASQIIELGYSADITETLIKDTSVLEQKPYEYSSIVKSAIHFINKNLYITLTVSDVANVLIHKIIIDQDGNMEVIWNI